MVRRIKKMVKNLMAPRYAKLNALKFGLALGLLCALSIIIFSLWVILIGTGEQLVLLLSQFYFGYSTTLSGMLIGVLYGFIDGFIGGCIFAWIYNKLI
ncbi:MAG: bacteriophage holin [Candidatus Pacearchaeota archaeon]